MRVRLRIRRYTPEKDKAPWWGEYDVEVEPTDRVLDALEEVKGSSDGSLAYRRSCAHGVCGSDAMLINGRNQLACKVLVKNVSQPVVIEPMKGFTVVKDLIVDMEPFFSKYRSVRPYLVNDEPAPRAERLQSPADRAVFDDTTKCILCGACTTSCPTFWTDPDYVGPAAIVQAHRFIFDSRDQISQERLDIMADTMGVWRCRTAFNCVEACPRGIDVTRAINEVKQAVVTGKTR